MQTVHPLVAGDTGLEIAPGKDVDENPDLKEIGNIWNAVPTAQHWTPIDPIEGCITVNIGDGLQWWTDGLFKSTYHRVRAPKDGDNKVNTLDLQIQVSDRMDRTVIETLAGIHSTSMHALILFCLHVYLTSQYSGIRSLVDSHPSVVCTH